MNIEAFKFRLSMLGHTLDGRETLDCLGTPER